MHEHVGTRGLPFLLSSLFVETGLWLNSEPFQRCWLAGEFLRPISLFLPALGLQESSAELGFTWGPGLWTQVHRLAQLAFYSLCHRHNSWFSLESQNHFSRFLWALQTVSYSTHRPLCPTEMPWLVLRVPSKSFWPCLVCPLPSGNKKARVCLSLPILLPHLVYGGPSTHNSINEFIPMVWGSLIFF